MLTHPKTAPAARGPAAAAAPHATMAATGSAPAPDGPPAPHSPTRHAHSRGQQARQRRTMHALTADGPPAAAAAPDAPVPDVPPLARPLLGGLYLTDLLVVSVSLAANLLRTCTLAELLDMVWFGTVYLGTCRVRRPVLTAQCSASRRRCARAGC